MAHFDRIMSTISPINGSDCWELPIETPLGVFSGQFTLRGLARLAFPRGRRRPGRRIDTDIPAQVRQWRTLTEHALRAALKGAEPKQLPPLDWSGATPFQRTVWTHLRKLRTGYTASYSQMARRIARPRAARAVGAACGANPIPVLVPCHRVRAANGALGGFSGGLDWKRKLLAAERVQLAV